MKTFCVCLAMTMAVFLAAIAGYFHDWPNLGMAAAFGAAAITVLCLMISAIMAQDE